MNKSICKSKPTSHPMLRLLAGALLVAMLLLLLASCGEPEPSAPQTYDYLAEDLTPYITLDESIYKNLKLSLKYDYVTEADVDDWISRILVSHRSEKPLNEGEGSTDAAIRLGDEVSIFYRGYYPDENGGRVYFTNGSNTSGTALKVTVGKMDNISGFETALVGLVPSEMTTLKNKGSIEVGDYITVSYFVLYPDRSYERTSKTFLFAPEEKAAIDAFFGEGFYDILASEEQSFEYGASNSNAYISSAQFPYESAEHGTGTVSYQDMVFLYGTSKAEPAVVAEAYFPATTSDETLQCKTAYFEMYLDAEKAYVVQYETPAFDDAFVLEQEEITMEELLKHEGDTLTEQYRSVVRELLEGNADERRMEYETLLYDAVFEELIKATTVKSYPEKALKLIKDDMQAELDDAFSSMGATYGYTDKEVFAKAYFGYTSGTFASYAEKIAKETVHRQMAFYGIAKAEGAVPTEAEKKAKAEALKEVYFAINLANNEDEYGRDNFNSDEEYQAAIDAYYEEMMEYYGEAYFLAEAEYLLIMEALSEGAEITVLGRKD